MSIHHTMAMVMLHESVVLDGTLVSPYSRVQATLGPTSVAL